MCPVHAHAAIKNESLPQRNLRVPKAERPDWQELLVCSSIAFYPYLNRPEVVRWSSGEKDRKGHTRFIATRFRMRLILKPCIAGAESTILNFRAVKGRLVPARNALNRWS